MVTRFYGSSQNRNKRESVLDDKGRVLCVIHGHLDVTDPDLAKILTDRGYSCELISDSMDLESETTPLKKKKGK